MLIPYPSSDSSKAFIAQVPECQELQTYTEHHQRISFLNWGGHKHHLEANQFSAEQFGISHHFSTLHMICETHFLYPLRALMNSSFNSIRLTFKDGKSLLAPLRILTSINPTPPFLRSSLIGNCQLFFAVCRLADSLVSNASCNRS